MLSALTFNENADANKLASEMTQTHANTGKNGLFRVFASLELRRSVKQYSKHVHAHPPSSILLFDHIITIRRSEHQEITRAVLFRLLQ